MLSAKHLKGGNILANNLKNQISGLKSKFIDLRTYWNIPMPGRYMTFKEIAAYAGGGIGAYILIKICMDLLVNSQNMIVGIAINVDPIHMYILYIIATIANIPLTALRATMVDNTKNKAGKYRPYLISMGVPTMLTTIAYVWFPYDSLNKFLPMDMFGYEGGYVVKCAIVLIFNLLLQFFYNFFYDAYTNLIHVLSPNSQERTDVLAIKSVVYSLGPSIVSALVPVVAQFVADDNLYDIRVYRLSYPIFALVGMALTVIVFGYTKEKIIQPKTRVVQIRFIDSFKSVAKNKYFWIIALAGWLGFLESAYGNILNWSYSYGHTASGTTMGLITTIISNASMWGMILAPFCIRKFGKKNVLIAVNFMNVVCILAMGLKMESIIWLAVCTYINYLFGAFEQITAPAIQADIRDYHQYKTGERIDGMFATVQTIGNVVTLVTSSVLPFVFRKYGIYEGNGFENSYDILDVDNGNGLLYELMGVLIIMAGVGAFLNMVPYFFYDLKEVQQKSIVRVLKIRAMFEDYGNGVSNDTELVETIDIIRKAKEYEGLEPKKLTKADKKKDKKAYKEALVYNEEIEISKIVLEELDKFSTPLYQTKIAAYEGVYADGLRGLYEASMEDIVKELVAARAMPGNTKEEKELRSFAIEIAQAKKSSRKAIDKYYKNFADFKEPDFSVLDAIFDEEDACEVKLKQLYLDQAAARKEKDYPGVKETTSEIKAIEQRKKELSAASKVEMDKHTQFARAAKPYIEAKKLMVARENYKHYDELEAQYEQSKANAQAAREAQLAEQKRLEKEKAARTKQLKEEKELARVAKKAAKKEEKK